MKIALVLAAGGMMLSNAAFAQSSVTVYGSLDQGVYRFTNVGGAGVYRVDPGTTQPDRFGFRGSEDLGGGMKALFQLEGGFSTDTGALINTTAFFNRLAVVGLSGDFGLISLGHQPDLMFDWVGKTSNGFLLSNFYAFHPGNIDTLANTFQFDNAIRYNTPTWNGLTLSAMGAPREGAGRNTSYGANYQVGPLRVSGAYSVEEKRTIRGFAALATSAGLPAAGIMDKVKNTGIGASYRFASFAVNSVYTQSEMIVGARSAKLKSLDLGGSYNVTPLDAVNLGYTRSKLNSTHWDTVSLMNLYSLSKRTQVYAMGTWQKANGAQVALLNGAGNSSTNKQAMIGAGIHHGF